LQPDLWMVVLSSGVSVLTISGGGLQDLGGAASRCTLKQLRYSLFPVSPLVSSLSL